MKRTLPALLAIAALAIVLPACSKSSSSSETTTTTTESSPAAESTAASGAMANASKSTGSGAQVYSQNCSSCHQAAGEGNAVFPPLAKNPVVTGDPKNVIHIVRNGLTGPVKVNGKTYNGQMPAWKSQLSAGDVAAVITYIRSSWGNKASAVTTAQVAADK
jgi:mono/diheme cytochrome c family protein